MGFRQTVRQKARCSRGQISNFSRLRQIDDEVWSKIATAINGELRDQLKGGVAENATPVAFTFSEYLLRNIIPLTADAGGGPRGGRRDGRRQTRCNLDGA